MLASKGFRSVRDFAFAGRPNKQMRSALRAFSRDEDGSLLIFGVYIFVLILMVGGIGIDLMRFERDRAELQYTLDRAVLAASDLEQTLDPKAVVQDYFDKAGLGSYLTGVSVSEGLGYRVVSATAKAEVKTQFMHMTGLDVMSAPAASTAEERIDSVEISLVLDVSGSMNSNSKLANLKVAARDFIDTMVNNTEPGKMSISIIPYATQVSTPEDFLNRFNLERIHEYSNCVNFTADEFHETSISTTQLLQQTMHFDPWNTSDRRKNNTEASRMVVDPVCEDDESREIMVMQNNATKLKDFITKLYADGNTSIDVGMKWGTALLDPAMRPVITGMISDGEVDEVFAARPHDFNSGDVLKVVVLMTDGQNTSQYYLNDGYGGVAIYDRDTAVYNPSTDFRQGLSNVYWNAQEKKYSIHVGKDEDDRDNDGKTEEDSYYWPFDGTWKDHPYGDYSYTVEETHYEESYECTSYKKNGSCRKYQTVYVPVTEQVTYTEPGKSEPLLYADLWANTPLQANVRDNYKPWMGNNAAYNDWYYDVVNDINSTEKNNRTVDICTAAKQKDVIVFTIGFEAPYGGREVLRNCASSAAHYFDVQGLEINQAFASIATSIRKLRLTQ